MTGTQRPHPTTCPDTPRNRDTVWLRVLVLTAVPLMALMATVEPALAHGTGGVNPSNHRVTVTTITPPAPELNVTVGTGGQWVHLSYRGAGTVTVAGYQGEPFLRIAEGRVLVNRNSTVLADNPRLIASTGSPAPRAAPAWQQVRQGTGLTWSDTRLTPETSRQRASATWRLPLRVDGTATTITGSRTWIAPPSRWPWVAAMMIIAATTAALGWLRRWGPAAVAILALAAAASVAHVIGSGLAAPPGSAASAWATALGFGVPCWALVAVGAVAAARGSEHGPFAVAVAGAVLAVISGPADLAALWHSQPPFAWPAPVQRALIVTALGAGAGLAVAGLRRIGSTTTGHDGPPTPGQGSNDPAPAGDEQ